MEIDRINIVSAWYIPHVGGVEKFTSYQSRELTKLGFEVNVITSDTEGVGFFEATESAKIYRLSSITSLAQGRIPIPFNPIQIIKVFKTCFTGKKALTIVHTRYYPISFLGAFLTRLGGSRLVVIDHSSGYIQFSSTLLNTFSKIYEHVMTFILKLFRPEFYGVSNACNEWLKSKFSITAKGVCPNGIDYSYKIKNRVNVKKKHKIQDYVFYGGRLIKEKGVLELIKGFEEFSRKYPKYHLIFAGSGDLADYITDYTKKNKKVIFVGRLLLDDMMSYTDDAWVIVNPTNYPEGLPTTLLEAGQYGAAVISTPNGGGRDIVLNNKTGILIEKGEAGLIRDGLIKLAKDNQLRIKLGKNFQKLVKNNYDWTIITSDFIFNTLKLKR